MERLNTALGNPRRTKTFLNLQNDSCSKRTRRYTLRTLRLSWPVAPSTQKAPFTPASIKLT
jgi:hypothetical protein